MSVALQLFILYVDYDIICIEIICVDEVWCSRLKADVKSVNGMLTELVCIVVVQMGEEYYLANDYSKALT